MAASQNKDLEEGVMHLKDQLEEEQALNITLSAAFNGAPLSLPSLSSLFLPPQVMELIRELAAVDAEILHLHQKIKELKLQLIKEQIQTQEITIAASKQKKTLSRQNHVKHNSLPLRHDIHQRSLSHSRLPFSYTATDFTNEIDGILRKQTSRRVQNGIQFVAAKSKDDPNYVSEELIKCLIGIYLELNQKSSNPQGDSTAESDLLLLSRRRSCSRKASYYTYYQNALNRDPYRVLSDSSGGAAIRDIGNYKNFIHISRDSIDVSCFTDYCSPAVQTLSVLMEKLAEVDLSFLTYKQKLAFWLNVYNACIMNAFLEYGLPSSHNKLLTLMNKASLNVGGIVLNALAIEHFVLRNPCEPEHGLLDEKETFLRHAYGLGYSEPNVTFALCRGNWSSPALRVYRADEVVNDLGRARVEFLEASVSVYNKKKIVIPQLLQWHMKDFADDLESLLEWIYSQLSRSGNLKRMIMECLTRKSKVPLTTMVEIQTYQHEFRYLLSL